MNQNRDKTLANGVCEACRVGAPQLSDQALAELLPQIPAWRVVSEQGVARLLREFSFNNFVEALAFANRVGELAEAEGHHPALLVEWGRLSVSWWTHKIKGLHHNDAIMAAKTDQLFNAFARESSHG